MVQEDARESTRARLGYVAGSSNPDLTDMIGVAPDAPAVVFADTLAWHGRSWISRSCMPAKII